jgi:tetratricopeptide (TPR) repeat protein
MHPERDYLRGHAFLTLAERLRERCHYLDVIDLRQGIENADEADEAVRDGHVLKVCLDEIERSRPFLVALLGDRYGWIPHADRITAAARVAGMAVDVAGRSVTELEILYGVLANREQARRSRFYFRTLDRSGMPPENAAHFPAEEQSDDIESPFRKLEKLKARIEKELPTRVQRYTLRWDAERGALVGLDELDQMVVRDLGADLEAETLAFLREAPRTPQEAEARELADFVTERTRCYVERPAVTGPMIEHAVFPTAPDGKWGLLVTGESGMGKSSIFGSVFAALQKRAATGEIILLAHAAGISQTAGQVDRMLRRWVAELASHVGLSDPFAESIVGEEDIARVAAASQATKPLSERIEQSFAELLALAAERRRVVVLVDALNQFESTVRATHLTWLPKSWPSNARMVATTIAGSLDIKACVDFREFEVPPISRDEALSIAKIVYRERYHRDVNSRVLDAILGKKVNGLHAHANPLWLGLALQEMNLLEADDFERADKEFASLPGAARMEALQLSEATRLAADVPGIYGELLDRAERNFGVEWTRALMSLLAVGRAGWREGDLRTHLVREVSGVPWDDARFAFVRRTLGSHLTQRGAQAQWDFFHPALRATVLKRNLADHSSRRSLHGLLAKHLQSLASDDPLRISETMVHLLGLGERSPAAGYLAGLAFGSAERAGAAAVIVEAIEGELFVGDGTVAAEWLASLLDEPGLRPAQIENIATVILYDINQGLQTRQMAELARQALLEASSRRMEALNRAGTASRTGQSALAISYASLARLWMSLGDGEHPMDLWKKAVAKNIELHQAAPAEAVHAVALSAAYRGLGEVQGQTGNKAMELEVHLKALEINRRLFQANPDSAVCAELLSNGLSALGWVYMNRGERAQALACLQECLQLREALCRKAPNDDDNARMLCTTYDALGNFFRDFGDGNYGAQGDGDRAILYYRKALEIHERLRHKNPHSVADMRGLSVSCSKLGELYRQVEGFADEAAALYKQDLEIAQDIHRRNARSADAARDLSVTYIKHGDWHVFGGAIPTALEFYDKALVIREGLYRQNPDAVGSARDLLSLYERLGKVHLACFNTKFAQEVLFKGLALGEELLRKNASSADTVWVVASLEVALGNALEGSDAKVALAHFEKALASLSGLVAEGRLPDERGRQMLQWLRGKVAQMRPAPGGHDNLSLLAKAGQLARLGRLEEAVAACDEVVAQHGTSREPAVRLQVVNAIMNKGTMLDKLGRSEDEIAAYDEILALFGDDSDPGIRAQVAGALLNKALTCGHLGRGEDEILVYRGLVLRFGRDRASQTRERVAGALLNMGATLGDMGRQREEGLAYDDLLARFGDAEEPAIRELVARAHRLRMAVY